ncbi:hypothetical protein [Streptomyces brasiliscabiei]|uniref:hypothetical protein n=1 Tax=Streptomyces brasiliscabiei TaxID=2736302 RepID=UPI001C12165F|nr:hypothetical protein [Streptomyces brasiliscabiei]
MHDDVVRAEYAQLRGAAIEVLDAMPDRADSSPQFEDALKSLRAVLAGETPSRSGPEHRPLDPFRHALVARRYTGQRAEPISLPERAVELRRRLEGDRGLEDRPPGEPSRNVAITELRAMIVAGLLEELAARLSPGAAFGPGRGGEELARLAKELADELLAGTFVGE